MSIKYGISDIFWQNSGIIVSIQNIQGTILLKNGYGIHYQQIDNYPERISPYEASLTVTVLAPSEEDDFFEAGVLTGKPPPFVGNQNLQKYFYETLKGGFKVERCNLETIAELATRLSSLSPASTLNPTDILKINTAKESPFRVTQYIKSPIDPTTGKPIHSEQQHTNPTEQPRIGTVDFEL